MEDIFGETIKELEGKFLDKEFKVSSGNTIQVKQIVLDSTSIRMMVALNGDYDDLRAISLRNFLDIIGYLSLNKSK